MTVMRTGVDPNGRPTGRMTKIGNTWYQKDYDPLSVVTEEDLEFCEKSGTFGANGETVVSLEKDWGKIRKAHTFKEMYG